MELKIISEDFCPYTKDGNIKQKPQKHLFCKASVLVTNVPADARLHRANKFASAAVHLPAALAGQSLQKRENL